MKNKITLISIFVVVALISYLSFVKFMDEDVWICTEAGWIEHGKPSFAKPALPCGETEVKHTVENYVKENISNISEQKAVLGGKFYVTKIEWIGNNSGLIEYEDGHIASRALFDYKIEPKISGSDFSVIIENFQIIK